MAITKRSPDSIHPPLGRYSHTVAVPPGARWVVVSGQVGVAPNGKIANGVEKQSERAFRNILACLKDHGMGREHLVKLTVFLTDPRHTDAFRAARDKVLGPDLCPASTLLIVTGLASPDLLVEVEAMAAAVPD